jgi:hypothetical protein
MSTTHTPGPWCVRDLPTAQRYIGPSQDGGAPSVALVLSLANVPEARLDADARLIAAAPDLLAALESIAAVAVGEGDVCELIACRARAAIAKATGSAT